MSRDLLLDLHNDVRGPGAEEKKAVNDMTDTEIIIQILEELISKVSGLDNHSHSIL